MILLDHLTALLGAGRHVPKISQTLAQENDQSDSLRSLLPRVMDQILSLSRQHPENEGSESILSESISVTDKDK